MLRVTLADRYIATEVLAPFLLGVGAFVVILIGDILYMLVAYISAHRMAVATVLQILGLKMPAILVVTFPVAMLFGTLLGLGRLAQHREIQAMKLGGLSLIRIFRPVLLFACLIAALTFTTNEFIAPEANHLANDLARRASLGGALPFIRQQVFFRGPGGRVFYVGQVDESGRVLRDVMIYETAGSLPRMITARRAQWNGTVWSLSDGVAREIDSQGFTRYEARFATMTVPVGFDGGALSAADKTPSEMTTRELGQYLRIFGSDGAGTDFAIAYYRKFAVPCASLVFAFLAAPFGMRAGREQRFVGVGVSVLLLFVYYVLMAVSRALAEAYLLSPAAAAWLPNVLFVGGGLILWGREAAWGRYLRRLPERPGATA